MSKYNKYEAICSNSWLDLGVTHIGECSTLFFDWGSLPVICQSFNRYSYHKIRVSWHSLQCWKWCKSRVRVMVFKATLNNVSVISWQSVLLVEETGVFGENHRPVASHWQTFSHNIVSSTPCHEQDSNFSDDRHWLHR